MKVTFDTLGCKLNQAETESLARQFAEAGHQVVSGVGEADVYILNTCTVTHIADARSRQRLRAAHRRNPDVLVVAAGCYAQRAPQDLARIDGVGLVVSNGEKPNLLRRLADGWLSRPVCLDKDAVNNSGSVLRTRTFIRVQDGCNHHCAYCIVPEVRGKAKSRPAEPVVAEVRQRVAEGYKEVVLTGTEVGAYDHGAVGLSGLLAKILAGTDVLRLRLSSLQPQELTPELVGLWEDNRLCPHFPLSLQSGSESVLRRMGRRYSTGDYQAAVSSIRERLPRAAITTDVIVGFPGETGEEFAESYEFCRDLRFARIHVFTYSARPGTAAARFPGQIDDRVKKERSQLMLALARESARTFRQQFSGQIMPVLWENQSADGVWSGLTDNYIKVSTRSSQNLTNSLQPVKLG